MGWNINDPSLGNDPAYLTPRIVKLERDKLNTSELGATVATLVDGQVPLDQLPDIETGGVKSVNSKLPDVNGDVAITIPSTPEDVGLSNVDNVKQMSIAGGTYTGIAKAHPNTSYTVAQLHNVILSTGDPTGGNNGDIWIKYV
ncbi:hypothetical protein MKY15_20555 [Sporosarcina sp. FSL K6-1540]|uniref:hypothetical protein n=1 Tax=Sporosarcina sp. FSL K6-1540 TaxID=2921555 RepID=UPI00315B3FA6